LNNKRPISVTIIAVIIILFGAQLLWFMPKTIAIYNRAVDRGMFTPSREPLSMLIAQHSLIVFVNIVSGIAMLKGFKWGRLLYIGGSGLIIAHSIFVGKFLRFSVPSVFIYLVFVLVLLMPTTSRFFNRSQANSRVQVKKGD